MAYSPSSNLISKNKHLENQILQGIKRLKSLGKKESKNQKKESLNNIALNLQNFISNALVNKVNDTKFFNINEELEEIEKIKKNQIKEEESFQRLISKYPLNEQLYTLNNDDNINNNNLIGLNNFKEKKKLSHPSNLNFYQNNNKFYNKQYSGSPLSNKFKKNIEKQDNESSKKNKKKTENNLNEQKTFGANISNNFFINSPLKQKNTFSESQTSSYIDFQNERELTLKRNIRKASPKYSDNLLTNYRNKGNNIKNNILYRKKQREKTETINKENIFDNLRKIYCNDSKRLFNSTISKDSPSFKTFKTYIPITQNGLQSSSRLSDNEMTYNKKYDKNDIRNILNLTSTQYQEFSKYCDKIKGKLLCSPKKTFTQKSNNSSKKNIISIKSLKDNILNNSKVNNNNENLNSKESLVLMSEKKTFSSEKRDENEINKNRMNINQIKEIYYRHLIRVNKLVYDSLSDEESDNELDYSFYINPKSKFKLYFDFMIFVITLYNTIVPPIMMSFFPYEERDVHQYYFSLNIIGDVFYISDLILGFLTAYYDIEEHFINKKSQITLNYLMSWFIIDLICAFPYTTFFAILNNFRSSHFKTQEDVYQVIFLLQLLPLIKIFKIYRNNEFYNKYKRFLFQYTILFQWYNTINLLMLFFIYAHILACVFVFLSYLDNPSWISTYNLQNSSKVEIYVTSFYYVFATVFTVGYGDIVSVNIYERFFNLILLVVGIMAYTYSISILSNYVKSVDHKTEDYNNKMTTLKQIKVTHEKMPKQLFEKIARFLRYRLTHVERDKNEIIDNLPIGLRTKLIIEMYKPIIDNFVFFKTYNSSDFILRVILAFRPILSMKNEKLVNEGDYLEEIVFVKKGSLSLELPLPILLDEKEIDDINSRHLFRLTTEHNKHKIIDFNEDLIKQTTMNFVKGKGLIINNNNNMKNMNKLNQQYVKIIEIRKNEHFGDILMFLNRRSPLSMKVKSKIAELYLLNKTEAVEISMSFPNIWEHIIKKSLFNMEQIERLINKTLKFFFKQNNIKQKKGSYYQKDISKKNIFVNCKDLYSSLSFEDCSLKTIPTVTENDNESSSNKNEKEKEKVKIKKKKKISSNISNYSVSDCQSSNSIDSNIENSKRSLSSKNLYFIKEVNSDEEKGSQILKRKRRKSTKDNITERENISAKKPTEGSKDYSDSDSNNFDSSSSRFKSDYDVKTLKTNEENKYFDFSTFSSHCNTIVYPKEEINNEELPFENNNINIIFDKQYNNNFFNGIVPKDSFIDFHGPPQLKNVQDSNSLRKSKKKNIISILSNLSTSRFNFQINSSNLKKKIKLKIIQNDSFSIIIQDKISKLINQNFIQSNTTNISKEEKDKKDNKNNPVSNSLITSSNSLPNIKGKKTNEKRFSKTILKSRQSVFFSDKKLINQNEVKSNNKLFSSGKLTLIGNNITSSSLALNNPKEFYINYFNKVVSNVDSNDKNFVSSRLKEIEKIIHNGQKDKRVTTSPFELNDKNNIIEKNENKN